MEATTEAAIRLKMTGALQLRAMSASHMKATYNMTNMIRHLRTKQVMVDKTALNLSLWKTSPFLLKENVAFSHFLWENGTTQRYHHSTAYLKLS